MLRYACLSVSNPLLRLLSDLYGVRVRPVAPFESLSGKRFVDPALIHRCLPDELLFEVLFDCFDTQLLHIGNITAYEFLNCYRIFHVYVLECHKLLL